MVCLHPGAVTFSCVRSMSCLPSSHQGEYVATSVRRLDASDRSSPWLCSHLRLHLYGVCEARRGVLPSPAPAAHRRQVNRGGLLACPPHRLVAAYSCRGLPQAGKLAGPMPWCFRNPALHLSVKTKIHFSAFDFISGRSISWAKCHGRDRIHWMMLGLQQPLPVIRQRRECHF